MKKSTYNLRRAFTLIELLIVVAIIALLTGIVMNNIVGSRQRARDSKRISDLGQIQLAFELFYDRCKGYPSITNGPLSASLDTSTVNNGGNCPSGVSLATFLNKIPAAPTADSYGSSYDYYTTGSDYILHTQIGYASDVLKDSLPESKRSTLYSGSNGLFTCYNNETSQPFNYCISPR